MSDHSLNAGRSANFLAAVLAVGMLLAAAVFLYQSSQVATVRASSHQYLLASLKAADGGAREPFGIPDSQVLAVALKTQPLNPAIVNAAMFADVARQPGSAPAKAQLELLERLGWRNTPALQNRIVTAVETQDLRKIVAIADALLRREDLVEQGQALMRLMEQSAPTRRQLADALAVNPNWRLAYFESPNKPQGPAAVGDRAKLAKMLAERGSPLTRPELAANLGLLADNGYAREAYELWRGYRGKKPMLVNDPDFVWAYRMRNDVNVGMPFEWELLTGSGFWTELVLEGEKAGVSINWNRRGVPVFLTQRLFLGSNRSPLVLQVDGVDLPGTLADDFSFALVCPDRTVPFDQLVRKSKTRYLLASREAATCADPKLSVAGRPFKVTSTSAALGADNLSVVLTGMSLRPAAN